MINYKDEHDKRNTKMTFDIVWARKYGWIGGILIERIRFFVEQNEKNDKLYKDGKYWYADTIENLMLTCFPGTPKSTIMNKIREMVKDGVIIRENGTISGTKIHTTFFTIDFNEANKVYNEICTQIDKDRIEIENEIIKGDCGFILDMQKHSKRIQPMAQRYSKKITNNNNKYCYDDGEKITECVTKTNTTCNKNSNTTKEKVTITDTSSNKSCRDKLEFVKGGSEKNLRGEGVKLTDVVSKTHGQGEKKSLSSYKDSNRQYKDSNKTVIDSNRYFNARARNDQQAGLEKNNSQVDCFNQIKSIYNETQCKSDIDLSGESDKITQYNFTEHKNSNNTLSDNQNNNMLVENIDYEIIDENEETEKANENQKNAIAEMQAIGTSKMNAKEYADYMAERWNNMASKCKGIRQVRTITPKRVKMVNACRKVLNDCGVSDDEILQALERIPTVKFYAGNNNYDWHISFDWYFKADASGVLAVLEQHHSDKKTPSQQTEEILQGAKEIVENRGKVVDEEGEPVLDLAEWFFQSAEQGLKEREERKLQAMLRRQERGY